MKKVIVASIAIGISLSACHSKKNLSQTTSATKTSSTQPSIQPQYAEGQALYAKNCNACHGLKTPANFTASKWNGVLPNMVKMANKKAGSEIISATDQEKILAYVLSECKK